LIQLSHIFQLPSPHPESEAKLSPLKALDDEPLVETKNKTLTLTHITDNILKPAEGNPRFDLLSVEGQVAVTVECKFSAPDATTSLSLTDIKAKQDLTHEALATIDFVDDDGLLQKLNFEPKNIIQVFCAFRDVGENLAKKAPQNCIVLTRTDLCRLYSPTLASRPQFILSRSKTEI
jgi:hypothetical protein